MSAIMPTFHCPGGRRIVGWPGSWAHSITSRPLRRVRAAPWTPEQDSALHAMVGAAAPWEEIAEILERSEQVAALIGPVTL